MMSMGSFSLLVFVPIAYALAMAMAIRHFFRGDTGQQGLSPWVVGGVAGMLLVRIVPATLMEGYACDVQTFQAWAIRAEENLGGFYGGRFFADYPPGYMYVLFLIGKLKELLLLPDRCSAFLLLVKLPAIVADLAFTAFIYRLALRQLGKGQALVFAFLYGLNPAVIFDSSVWGQVDGFFTLFMLLAVHCLTEDRLSLSTTLFAAALLIKPQALIFTPLFLAVAADRLLISPEKGAVRRVAGATAAGILVFAAGILPFAVSEGALWIFSHYRRTLTSYPFASVNAYNLFALSGANFAQETTPWLLFSYRNWGTFFILMATLFSFRIYFRGRKEDRLYLMGAFLIAAVFIFASRMHERYLFPALAFSLVAALRGKSREMLLVFAGFSITHYLNVAHVFIAAGDDVYGISATNPFLLATAAANLLLFSYLVRHVFRTWSDDAIPAPVQRD